MPRCYECFQQYEGTGDTCPHCGKPIITEPREPVYLAPGTEVGGRYILGDTVGAGGFGIVYKAWDSKLETIVAVKEFFAPRLMTRAQGAKTVIVAKKSQEEYEYRKERFLAEARNMAKFSTHRSIPNVYEYFEENNTAYIVMELLEGMALNEYLAENDGKVEPELAIFIAEEVGEALESLHAEKIIHRDVAPDNIFICSGREIRIKLMDLGAAKLSDTEEDVTDIILKPGYSPAEQYDNSKNIGPWTDIYALGATLYAMLTGVKPEESTNRKIADTVKYPHEIDPEIPENVSNTIMRAMAVDRHLRFQTVTEFLDALRGKKKVSTVEMEKKRRARKRLLSILAACLALAVIGGVIGFFMHKQAEEASLKEATIKVWFPVAEGSNREAAMKSVVTDFMEKFPKVTVEVKAIPKDDYAKELTDAAKDGTFPNLFVSSGINDADVWEKSRDVSAVLQSEQAKECLFLDQYDSYYAERKQIPLGFEAPMAVVITKGPKQLSYEKEYFSTPNDFALSGKSAMEAEDKALFVKNGFESYVETKTDSRTNEVFFKKESYTSPLLFTTTMAINTVREKVTDFSKEFVYLDRDEIYCRFVYEWSLGEGSEEENAAAERLLSWMLGSVYQNTLMISEASDGELPLNKTCFETKTDIRILAPLKEIYMRFRFGNAADTDEQTEESTAPHGRK